MSRVLGRIFAIGGLSLALAGCATEPADPGDPLEGMNRAFFNFNQKLDQRAALPAATFYVSAVPSPIRTGIHNFLSNINLPITLANDLLQFQFTRAGYTIERFGLNTTIGILGLVDVASERGIPYHTEDFGQTLGYYGLPGGPYLVLPLLGSTQPRDLGGRYVDHYFNAFGYLAWNGKVYYSLFQSALSTVDSRSRNINTLRNIERQSIDMYSTIRSLYLQNRENQIRNGEIDTTNLPDF
ncbi:MAG TPA: VacJ family lipoprotein [Rhizomicrobium sp.]|nr:VacJ family lipoprotein [Rhizomicrobium sp.]